MHCLLNNLDMLLHYATMMAPPLSSGGFFIWLIWYLWQKFNLLLLVGETRGFS